MTLIPLHPRVRALSPWWAHGLWRATRLVLLVGAVMAGLLGMHVLAPGSMAAALASPVTITAEEPPASLHGSAAVQGPATNTAIIPTSHAAHAKGGAHRVGAVQSVVAAPAVPPASACSHGKHAPVGAAAHCTPALGTLPPEPPAGVVLERSDALQSALPTAVPGAVRARAPVPDLAELSVSRT